LGHVQQRQDAAVDSKLEVEKEILTFSSWSGVLWVTFCQLSLRSRCPPALIIIESLCAGSGLQPSAMTMLARIGHPRSEQQYMSGWLEPVDAAASTALLHSQLAEAASQGCT
jgi:hypothetical protein